MITPPFEKILLQRKPSKQILGAQLTFFCALSYVIYTLSLPVAGKAILLVISTAIFIAEVRNNAWIRSPRAIKLICLSKDRLTLTHANNTSTSATLLPYSLISPYLTILVVKYTKRLTPQAIYLTADNCNSEDYRRLRVYLGLRGKKLLITPTPTRAEKKVLSH